MPAKSFAVIAAFVFLIVALAQVARVVLGFGIVIDGMDIPVLASIAIAVVAGALSLLGFTSR